MKIDVVKVGYLEENCYMLSIKDECLIVDPGDEFDIIKKVVGNKKVLGILITHHHFDHVGALKECINYYSCPVIDYKNKISSIGPFKYEIIPTPGHKEDSVTYYFKDEKVMFVGDFIFKESIGRCDLEGGNISDMQNSINMIKKYGNNITLYPGHGDKTTLGYEKENNVYLR